MKENTFPLIAPDVDSPLVPDTVVRPRLSNPGGSCLIREGHYDLAHRAFAFKALCALFLITAHVFRKYKAPRPVKTLPVSAHELRARISFDIIFQHDNLPEALLLSACFVIAFLYCYYFPVSGLPSHFAIAFPFRYCPPASLFSACFAAYSRSPSRYIFHKTIGRANAIAIVDR